MTRNDSSHDDDGGGDDDDVGDDDDDDGRAGDDDDAVLSCDNIIVIPIRNRWAKCPPPIIGKATLLSPRSHTWLEANGFKYSSSPRLTPPRSQPLVPQGRIWLEA